METQAAMDVQLEGTKTEDMTEEQFLKDLYLFMKKRDTPIERIPNLGFKQIDLFVMFKVVRDLGGYHQVTAQQLWKQVYNTLGGNPRSTSAATCTRRHYERLLLPYECHVTGVLVNVLPRSNQPKHFHFNAYKEHEDGQRAAKRKLLAMPMLQNHHNLQSDSVFPLPPHYPHYYHHPGHPGHPGHPVLSPPVPMSPPVMTPHTPPAPKTWFPFPPSYLSPMDRVKEPLEQLRYLAEQYKSTSRLSEPLNLSVKAARQETSTTSPASSFTPPSSSKNPKFLNKPSPLYTHHQPPARNNGETQDGDAGGDAAYSCPAKAREAYEVKAVTPGRGSPPAYDSALVIDESSPTRKPSSPKTEKEERRGSPEVRELNLSHFLPSLPRENGGKMEIEVPLSVFHNWLRLCGSNIHGPRAPPPLPPPPRLPPPQEAAPRNCSDTVLPATFHVTPQHWTPAPEDLRLPHKNLPSAVPATSSPRNPSQRHFPAYRPPGLSPDAVYPFDMSKSCGVKSPNRWDVYEKEPKASSSPTKQDFVPLTSFGEDANRKEESTSAPSAPSAMLMLNSGSSPLLQLTTEEVMKLKKMISSSV